MSREELMRRYVDAILDRKRDITREELMRMIEEKKKEARVSEAYREVWAVFSIANELGIRLEEVSLEKEIKINSIVSGLASISTRGRIIAILEPKEVESNGEKIPITRVILGDSSGWCYLYFWREKAGLLQELNINVGDVIRVSRAYSKEGRLGTIEIHLGNMGSVSKVEESPDIPRREAFFKNLGEIGYDDNIVNVKAMVIGVSELKRFSDSKGGERTVRRIVLADGDVRIPLTLWHEHSGRISEKDVFSSILVAGARVRKGLSGNLELELNSLGCLEVLGKGGKAEYSTLSEVSSGKPVNLKLHVLKMFNDNVFPAGGRIRRVMDIIVSDGEAYGVLTVWNSLIDRLKQMDAEGKKISFLNLVPRSLGRQVLLSTTSSTTIAGVEESTLNLRIPEKVYRVSELEPGLRKIHVEGVVSTKPEEQDVISASGESIKVCRLNLVDDTGLVEVVAWRENTGKISGLTPGRGVRIKWCNVRERGVGRIIVEVTPDSEVEMIEAE
jgi:ssDNA-binding replication factor A large subunit